MSSLSDFPARMAPASIIAETLCSRGIWNKVNRNLSQRASLSPSLTYKTYKVLFNIISSIFPSVPLILLLSESTMRMQEGKSRQLSFVPEKPIEWGTLMWSQDEEVIDSSNWFMSFGKTQKRSQKLMHFRFSWKTEYILSICERESLLISNELGTLKYIWARLFKLLCHY